MVVIRCGVPHGRLVSTVAPQPPHNVVVRSLRQVVAPLYPPSKSPPDKGIDIKYNYLNLPYRIDFNGTNNWIEFLYDASGQKLRKTTSAGLVQDYVSGIEYKNANLEAIYHEEGRAIPDGNSFKYQYALKDHLGNVRVMFSDDGNGVAELLSENHFYAFGLQMNGNWNQQTNPEQNYLYNGKEIADDYGLDWYFYGARMYDPAVARFTGVDPISDRFPWVSTYNYAENEPIANIDLHGLQKFNVTQFDKNKQNLTEEGKAALKEGENKALKEVIDVVVDEIPVVGEMKSLSEGDVGGALLGSIPLIGGILKKIKGGVYILKNTKGVVKRSGRSKDLDKRKKQHANGDETKDLIFDDVHRTDDYSEQRGLEHKLYEEHSETANFGKGGLNKVKAIGDKNKNKNKYIKAANNYLKNKKDKKD